MLTTQKSKWWKIRVRGGPLRYVESEYNIGAERAIDGYRDHFNPVTWGVNGTSYDADYVPTCEPIRQADIPPAKNHHLTGCRQDLIYLKGKSHKPTLVPAEEDDTPTEAATV